MAFDSPLTFQPLYMERIWGGRRIGSLPGRTLPPERPIGESWELCDREDAQSVVSEGPYAGTTLHELWVRHRTEVFGAVADAPRCPLLAKILDARETLSVQVHPPAAVAVELGGEPKTEMWHVLDANEGAELYVGFSKGVTQAAFAEAVTSGQVAQLLHRIPVKAGDSIFIPSGRCHAIGGGCLIVEIQQNSDTTYRVHDWDRLGLDGKPRPLHVEASLRSIDFTDHAPGLNTSDIMCEHFCVQKWEFSAAQEDPGPGAALFSVIAGAVECGGRAFEVGQFFLLPAAATNRTLWPRGGNAQVLRATIPAA